MNTAEHRSHNRSRRITGVLTDEKAHNVSAITAKPPYTSRSVGARNAYSDVSVTSDVLHFGSSSSSSSEMKTSRIAILLHRSHPDTQHTDRWTHTHTHTHTQRERERGGGGRERWHRSEMDETTTKQSSLACALQVDAFCLGLTEIAGLDQCSRKRVQLLK